MQLLKKYVITKGVVAENICPVWLHIKWHIFVILKKMLKIEF